jgi:hypothetical protein
LAKNPLSNPKLCNALASGCDHSLESRDKREFWNHSILFFIGFPIKKRYQKVAQSLLVTLDGEGRALG